jgi:hypothetical protein
VTEVNGNPGTGIIEITKKNHFVDLVAFIESKSKKNEAIPVPVPLPDTDQEETEEGNEEEASLANYRKLLAKQEKTDLSYNESGMLAFFRKKFGSKV